MQGHARALDVWMNGERVGVWYSSRTGVSVFEYDTKWLSSPRVRPLSLSLPLLPGNQPHRGEHVTNWFDNLLPDSDRIRDRLTKRYRASSNRALDLLAAIGRDCVGAVQIVPAGESPGEVQQLDVEPLTEPDIARLLRNVTAGGPLGPDEDTDDFRISIAGAQEKTALTRVEGRWFKPRGATPTTHLLKLPLGLVGGMRANMEDPVENEWLCMQLLQAIEIPVAETAIETFRDEVGEQKALVVKRFDRASVPLGADPPNWILRLPQEDFCQATGTPSDRKYESEGGPNLAKCLSLLAAGARPQADALVFAKAQLAFWLLAATDGHAKNFSIFLQREGYVMTPLYDVLSAWPVIGPGPNQVPIQKAQLAMALRGKNPHRKLQRITVRHWRTLASQTAVPNAFEQMVAMVDSAEGALASLELRLPPGFPERVWVGVAEGVRKHREQFLSNAAAVVE